MDGLRVLLRRVPSLGDLERRKEPDRGALIGDRMGECPRGDREDMFLFASGQLLQGFVPKPVQKSQRKEGEERRREGRTGRLRRWECLGRV